MKAREWGDDLPPHPSPNDGHGKPVPDRMGGQAGVEATNGVKGKLEEGSWWLQHGGRGNEGKQEVGWVIGEKYGRD